MGCFCNESFDERNEALIKCINDVTGLSFDLGLENNNRINEVIRNNDNKSIVDVNLFNNNYESDEKKDFQNIENQVQNKIEQCKRLDINKSDLSIYRAYENSNNLSVNNQNNKIEDVEDNKENYVKEKETKE